MHVSDDISQITSKLYTCGVCEKYYLNPVLLPCGKNICAEHVNKMTINKNCSWIGHRQ